MKNCIKINSIFLLLFLFFQYLTIHGQDLSQPEKIVQQQVNAYNAHDLETFLSFYSDSVAAYIFPNYPLGKGKEAFRLEYGRQFRTAPNRQVEIKERICLGDYVIDKEFTTGMAGCNTLEGLAIYKVEDNLISTVWFIYK